MRRFAALLLVAVAGARLPAAELDPIGRGTYAVGSTNFEVIPRPERPMVDYLNGWASPQNRLYVTDILSHPESALVVPVEVPANPAAFGSAAGTKVPVALYVLYPTTSDNPRADYEFPYRETGDNRFPHMQRAGEKPIFADPKAKYPLIVYSGGYFTHGLWHLEHLKALASHGYIVVDIFHGDGRGPAFDTELRLRALEFKAVLDFMLAHPDFAPAVDRDRIGASGASAGGHTILTAMGGIDPTMPELQLGDPRIKAGFGLVPFLGGSFGRWPFKLDAWLFGRDFAGLRSVRVPFLAIYAAKDVNVPPASVEAGVRQVSGPVSAVVLDGETHDLSAKAPVVVNTWEILFFDTWLRGNSEARALLYRATSVHGGTENRRTFQRAAR